MCNSKADAALATKHILAPRKRLYLKFPIVCILSSLVAQFGSKRRAVAVLKSNLIRTIEFGTAVARSTFETGLRLYFRFRFDMTAK